MFDAFARGIARADTGEFWCAFGVVAALAAVLLYQAYRRLAHKRLIEDMPTTRLRAAAQGYVELKGTARLFAGEPIVAPLSGRQCCWYRYSIEQHERAHGGHRERRRWTRIDGGESTGIFMLDDDTGRCAVDPEGATITPSTREVWYGNSRFPPRLRTDRSRLGAWLARLAGGHYRFREEVIDIGAPLYALGFFRTHGGAATPADTSGDAGALLREWKADRARLLERFDANRDGDIDAAEWERARLAAHEEVARARAATASAPLAVDLLSRPSAGDQPYLLAARHEEDLTGHHGLSAALCLVGGLALGIGTVWALATRLTGSA